MGMINQPQVNTEEPSDTPILNPSTEEQNPDDVRYKNPLEVEDSELNITNEAVRLISLKRELGLDAMDKTKDVEIKGILDWAKEVGIKNRNELLSRIREIDFMLGNPDDKPKIDKIYQYVVLKRQARGIFNKLEALRK